MSASATTRARSRRSGSQWPWLLSALLLALDGCGGAPAISKPAQHGSEPPAPAGAPAARVVVGAGRVTGGAISADIQVGTGAGGASGGGIVLRTAPILGGTR